MPRVVFCLLCLFLLPSGPLKAMDFRCTSNRTAKDDPELAGQCYSALAEGAISRLIAADTRWDDCATDNECCASACALLFIAGAQWTGANLILHRPSSKELGMVDYDTAAREYAAVEQRVLEYFKRMEANLDVYKLMMETSSTARPVFLKFEDMKQYFGVYGYPATLHEWLASKCVGAEKIASCMFDAFKKEQIGRAKEAMK